MITAWLPYRFASVEISPGCFNAAVFRLTLSAPASIAAAASSSDRMPPPTVSGRKISRATAAMVRARARPFFRRGGAPRRLPLFQRRGDIENHDLVNPLDVVAPRKLAGIAGVPQLLELHALDHLPVADVQARDDPLGQHEPAQTRRKFLIICNPGSLDFSG